jgi:hypothetical protein
MDARFILPFLFWSMASTLTSGLLLVCFVGFGVLVAPIFTLAIKVLISIGTVLMVANFICLAYRLRTNEASKES